MSDAEDGRRAIETPGLTYHPHFISKEESEELIRFFGAQMPLWEQRHRDPEHRRSEDHSRRLTRPVYWLGAWQFACLGYYAEPNYREHRCMRAEALPEVMQTILERARPILAEYHQGVDPEPTPPALPNTCLINYYGREVGKGVPRDYARLRMHQDLEPGPAILFNIGQAGLLEFIDPEVSLDPVCGVWARHRSLGIFSGPEFKDRLYHRVSQVRTGDKPEIHTQLDNFELRRVSVSFRHVPQNLIEDFSELPNEAQSKVRDYVEELARTSPHYRAQLANRG
ncbi:MAG: alpha-ketoglutarate-dependent dioxygenase AlkB [Myxococcales bacterium]|nr:alpha-ketoglutarate-dependent dioxygenase AlkB [Myxococcales bacterium]